MSGKQSFSQHVVKTFTPGKKVNYATNFLKSSFNTVMIKPAKVPVRTAAIASRAARRTFSKKSIPKLLADLKLIQVSHNKQDASLVEETQFADRLAATKYVNTSSNFDSKDYVDNSNNIIEFLADDSSRRTIMKEHKPDVLTAIANALYVGTALNDKALTPNQYRRYNNRLLQLAKITHSLESSGDVYNIAVGSMVPKYSENGQNNELQSECKKIYNKTPDEIEKLEEELADLRLAVTGKPVPAITLESVNSDILVALQENLLSKMLLSEFASDKTSYKNTINKSGIMYVKSVLHFLKIVKLITNLNDNDLKALCESLKCSNLLSEINNNVYDVKTQFTNFQLPVAIAFDLPDRMISGDYNPPIISLDHYTNKFKLLAVQLIYCKGVTFNSIVTSIISTPQTQINTYDDFTANNIASDNGQLLVVEANLKHINAINEFINILKNIIEDIGFTEKYHDNQAFAKPVEERTTQINSSLNLIRGDAFVNINAAATLVNVTMFTTAIDKATPAFEFIKRNVFNPSKKIFKTHATTINTFCGELLTIFNATEYVFVAKTLSTSIIANSGKLLTLATDKSIDKSIDATNNDREFPNNFSIITGGKRRTLKKRPKKTAKHQPRVIRKSSRMNKKRSMRR